MKGFPDDPIFRNIVRVAANSDRRIIRDPGLGIEVGYRTFLSDVLRVRMKIQRQIPLLAGGNRDAHHDGIYIAIMAPSNYHQIVAFFAILAMGAVAVFIPTTISPEEGRDLIERCNSTTILFGSEYRDWVNSACSKGLTGIKSILIPFEGPEGGLVDPITINPSLQFTSTHPAMVQFTSGSTGSPKGVVHPREFFYRQVEVYFGCSMEDANGLVHLLGEDALYLSFRAFWWSGGLRNMTAAILAGVCVEVQPHAPTPQGLWERLRKGDVAFLICQSFIWTRMKDYYDETLMGLPPTERREYEDGVARLRLAKNDSGVLTPLVRRFWSRLLGGQSIAVNYAATEMSIALGKTNDPDENTDERVIGKPLPGVQVKLSENDQGEIRLKSPLLFQRYIRDPEATRAAFDEEGFYKTGDLGHKDGDNFVIDGRVSTNVFRVCAYRVLTMEVEEVLASLPYVCEGYVLGVPDTRIVTRVAALVRLRGTKTVNLETIREDMRSSLSPYKRPGLLRILGPDEQVPRTSSGKFDLPAAREKFFHQKVEGSVESLPEGVEVLDLNMILADCVL
ncbi:unnamed protein product [Penicillium salamii]|nr:unnamed protein product [Penicillium salamii]